MVRPLRAFHLASLLLLGTALGACGDSTDATTTSGDDLTGSGDKRDPADARGDRVAAQVDIYGRHITLHLSDADNAGWANIDGGQAGDEVWLDRSFDGGFTWRGGSRLGDTQIPKNWKNWRTLMYVLDFPSDQRVGALRACGKAGDRKEIVCTEWFRTTVNAKTPIDAAATALMELYDPGNGKWKTTGWWNDANALTSIIDYSQATGSTTYEYAISNTFQKNRKAGFGNGFQGGFTNDFLDDTGWWGLAWIRAYDLTGDKSYLDMAANDAQHMWDYQDATCGGGIWWKTDKKQKNAIENELFIKLAASIHNRTPGDTTWRSRADQIWRWFDGTGMINGDSLINDGIDGSCHNNGSTTWTYNQGVILGGLVELAKADGDDSLLNRARSLGVASTGNAGLNPSGLLREPGGTAGCQTEGATFEGVYVRNLGELDKALPDHPFHAYLTRQATALLNSRNGLDQYGTRWGDAFDCVDANRQHSALDLLVAAH